MSTLIALMSHHGTSLKAANLLKNQLEDDFITIIDLKKEKNPDLSPFDIVIVGGSIHAGNIQKEIKKFCQKQKPELLRKVLGLFLCCMEEGENARKQFDNAFDKELKEHALACGYFGGEFNFQRMNFIEKIIVRKVAKVSESTSKIDHKAISGFAEKFIYSEAS